MSETNLHNRKKPSKPLTGKDAVKKVNDVQNDDGITWQLNSNHVAQLQQRQQEIGRKVFRRAIKRVLLLAVALLVVYMYRKWTQDTVHTFASSREPILQAPIALEVACSVSDYDRDRQQFPRCCPFKCGRVVSDAVISEQEASGLLAMAKRTFDLTKSNGSASILGKAIRLSNVQSDLLNTPILNFNHRPAFRRLV